MGALPWRPSGAIARDQTCRIHMTQIGQRAQRMYRLAFDIGGTFTDFVLEDTRDHTLRLWKVPSSTGAPADAVVTALRDMLADGDIVPSDISAILHATTVATNAILERKGARTALVTTRGFRDIALLGRQKRPTPMT